MPKLLGALAGAALLVSTSAVADPVRVDVTDAWARATPPGAGVGAAYFSLRAHGTGADRLVGASTPAAAKAEMHTSVMQGTLMKMQRMEAVEVRPGAPVTFAPGGNHLMLMGLRAPLEEGDRFPLTLTFEKAGDVVVEVQVEGPGAMSAGGGHGTHTPMESEGHGHARPQTRKE